MIYGRPPKAYAQIDGRWYQVYTIRFYEQIDLFGETIKMCSFTVGKKGKQILEQPIAQMELKKTKDRQKTKGKRILMLKIIKRWLGIRSPSKDLACALGRHDWQPTGNALLVWVTKWNNYHATPLQCENCGKIAERREETGY